ncbi:nose resistant to fluoxetine protein 6-like [Argiope bruennichi]|uniref:nose resistant to fluoxetine protein 6-like n=1 Tax=Argiope bruennichi TaxID=94029 RepID=UPI0024951ED7|nr:nose resistant to fluoxetine protein 6-like [Argiope bruennichi]
MSNNVFKTSERYQYIMKTRMTLFFYNGAFVIDTFFVLSGLLNAYSFCHRHGKSEGKISWISFYARRFLRISPLYFFVIGFYSTLFSYLGSGVLWPTYDTNPVCKENWIWHILYANNFLSHMKECLLSTWYLPCEMQLYIISPIFLLLLMRFWEYFDMLYVKPFPRLGSYLIGITLGHYLYQRKFNPIKPWSQVTLSLGWIITALFLWISIFALYGREENVMEFAVYNGLKHLLFSCSVVWVIFVCATGQGGFVNKFLSNKVFIVISSVSFSTYLTHLFILERYYLMLEELQDFSVMLITPHLALQYLQIFIVSAVVSTIFEAPMSRITELFLDRSKQKIKSIKQI